MLRISSILVFSLLAVGCGAASSSRLQDFKDVKKAVLRDDGLYNVICMDGSIETGVSLQQIEDDAVCDKAPSAPTFLSQCLNPPDAGWKAALSSLALKAGTQDCAGIHAALRSKHSLQFFAYPPIASAPLLSVEPLRYLPELKSVSVYAQGIQDAAALGELPQLAQLRLPYNDIAAVKDLSAAKSLRYLDISHNRIDDPLIASKFPQAIVEAADNPKKLDYEAVPLPTHALFSGHALIHAAESDPLELDQVLGNHRQIVHAAAAAVPFTGPDFEKVYGIGGTMHEDIKKRSLVLQTFIKEALQRGQVPEGDRTRVGRWWEAQLQAIALPPSVDAEVRTQFKRYCDAKIVELAAHPEFARLAGAGYKERPSPQPFCELYYAEQKLLQGPDCAPAGHAFRCLWKEGVLKTGAFADEAGQAVREQIAAVFEDEGRTEIFRRILQADQEVSAPYLSISSTILKKDIFQKKTFFYAALVQGKPSIGTETACLRTLDASYAFICGAFTRGWGSASPGSLITTVQFASGLSQRPSSEDLNRLTQLLNYFGVRMIVNQPQLSRADLFFHRPVDASGIVWSEGLPMNTEPAMIDHLLSLLDKTLHALQAEDVQVIHKEATAIEALKQKVQAQLAQSSQLAMATNDALINEILAANRFSSVLAFARARFAIETEGSLVKIAFILDPSYPYQGCFDAQTQSSISCPLGPSNIAVRSLTSGRLQVSLRLDDPAVAGWPQTGRSASSPDFFSELPTDELRGASLHFDLKMYRYKGMLPLLIGSVRVESKGVTLYEGVVSQTATPTGS